MASCSDRDVAGGRSRCLGLVSYIGVQAPQVPLCFSLQPHLLFGARSQRLNPNYPKLRLVLPILKCDRASHLESTTNRAQPNSGLADIESMDQFRVGIAGNVAAKNSYRQHRLGSIQATFFVHRRFHLFCPSFVRRVQNATSFTRFTVQTIQSAGRNSSLATCIFSHGQALRHSTKVWQTSS